MTESSLTTDLLRELRARLPGAVVMKHSELRLSGVPDFSVTLGGRTSWFEVKYGPRIISKGIQQLTCARLASAGMCRYIFFEEKRGVRRTLVLHPKHIDDLMPEVWHVGFNHRFVCDFVRQVHGV